MTKFKNKTGISGFTLVELSIVIVIIGFLVAGIAAGSNMVKQAQLRSVITDIQSYQTAYNGFIGRYNKAPGDLDVASSYWPATDGSQCVENATAATNCDGDGDGVIETGTTVGGHEVAKVWKHMQLAGFINSGISTIPNGVADLTPGTNAPTSKFSGLGYFITGSLQLSSGADDCSIGFGNNSKNHLYFGKAPGARDNVNLTGGAFTPEDAFNLDTKMDDGIVSSASFTGASTGRFKAVAAVGDDFSFNADCTDANGVYNFNQTIKSCLVGFALN